MKGLNVPKIAKKTQIDVAFEDIADFLSIDEEADTDILTQIYQKFNTDQDGSNLDKIGKLVPLSFAFIHRIQNLSIQQSHKDTLKQKSKDEKYLIAISLHDMKIFNQLVNFIVVQLIYPVMPLHFGIPLEERRLKSFSQKSKLFQFKRLRNNQSNDNYKILLQIATEFSTIFQNKSDVRDLLIKGSGLTDIIASLVVLIIESDPKLVTLLESFENTSDTYNLFNIYTILIQTTTLPKYKSFLTTRLTNLMLNRPNGVISLIDFLVGIRDEDEINIESFNRVNAALMTKPKYISSVEYFTKIFNQIYDILVFVNRPILNSVVINFITIIYDRNGLIVRDFLFKRIWGLLDPKVDNFNPGDTIVSEKQFNDCINVLISLTKETSKEFLNELFGPIILNLWGFYMYLTKKNLEYSNVVSNILVSYFTLTSNEFILENLILNLIHINGENWKFQTTLENNLTSIVRSGILDNEDITNEEIFDNIEIGLKNITNLFKNLSNETVRSQFLKVLNRWITQENKTDVLDEINPFLMLSDLRFLERINESFKDVLMDKPEDLLLVIKNLLETKFKDEKQELDSEQEEIDSDDEDDELSPSFNNLTVLLELLSAIISETNPSELSRHNDVLKEISNLLSEIPSNKHCNSLHKRIEDFLKNKSREISEEDDERLQDKELFEKAITNINDPLIPIRAHGLYILRQLITKKSKILDLDMVLELHILQLHDSEPFIYLNVIKSLNELIEFDQNGTLKFLLKLYINKKDQTIDDRLKVGEVILNYITRSNEMFNGPIVEEIISNTLNLIRDFEEDDRLRMSAMSLIGQGLRTNAIGIEKFIKDSLDCSIGILELEKNSVMKRSAVVLVSDLLSFGGLDVVPKGYGEKLKRLMNYSKLNADDYLLVEQIDKVLQTIEDLIKEKFTNIPNLPSQLESLSLSR